MSEADKIRKYILDRYIIPACEASQPYVDVRAGDVYDAMVDSDALPSTNTPNVCQVLKGNKMLEFAEIDSSEVMDEPPSGQEKNVTVCFNLN